MSAPGAGPPRDLVQQVLRAAVLLAAGVAVLLSLLWLLKAALTPLAVAFALAYLLDPLVDRMERLGMRRGLAILLLMLAGAVGLWLFALWVVPEVRGELAGLAERLPGYLEKVRAGLVPRLRSLGVELPQTLAEAFERAGGAAGEAPLDLLGRLVDFALRSVSGTVGAVVGAAVVPVIAYYMLARFDEVTAALLSVVPQPYQADVALRARRVDALLSGFVRGQLTVCALLAALYTAGFALLGVPLAVLIGLLSGALAFIPYLGSAFALVTAALFCLLEYGVGLRLAGVAGWYLLIQNLEGFVLTPRIVGGSVGLHPVAVIVALLIGGDLLGFLGLIVAVPLAALVQVFTRELLDRYRESALFGAGPNAGV